jgi:hypothetical protein
VALRAVAWRNDGALVLAAPSSPAARAVGLEGAAYVPPDQVGRIGFDGTR